MKSFFESLTDEQKEKAKQCTTMEELTEFVTKEGIELPDEMLDAVAGGIEFDEELCGMYDCCPRYCRDNPCSFHWGL